MSKRQGRTMWDFFSEEPFMFWFGLIIITCAVCSVLKEAGW